MTELDFEELDKAVNDLMQEGGPAPAPTNDNTTVTDDAAKLTDDDAPKQDAPVGAAPLALKRRGRFMDVVAPVGIKRQAIDGMVSRQGVTIAAPGAQPEQNTQGDAPQQPSGTPDATDVTAEPQVGEQANTEGPTDTGSSAESTELLQELTDSSDYAANPVLPQEQPEAVELADTERDIQGEANDGANQPLDLPQEDINEPVEQTEQPAESEHDDVNVNVDTVDSYTAPTDTGDQLTTVIVPDETQNNDEAPDSQRVAPADSAMTSPFLPDAKVEKRPLGGEPASTEAADQPVPPAAEMPREYSPELLSLDADKNTFASGDQRAQPVPNKPAEITVQQQAAPLQAGSATVAAAGATASSIFDTDTYHTPLKQPAKVKSGWLTLVWILALLIIGSIAGAAYFYFTTQR